jgi:hypothetical protein
MSAKPSFFSVAPISAPATDSPPSANAERAIDAVAGRHGFVERQPPQVLYKRRKTVDEPTHSFTARVSVRSANGFIAWCEREHLSYRQGFDHLMALLEANPDVPVRR